MKEEIIMEQPETESEAQSAAAQENEEMQDEQLSGSKFKDSKTLLEAYNNLQSDYTKKCQALAAVTKDIAENKEALPAYLKNDWQDKINKFLGSNPQAEDYFNQIQKLILSDKEIALSVSPLETAWNKVMKENFKSPVSLAEDDTFIEKFILTNEKLKTKIINDYFSQINLESAPTLIANHQGSKSVMAPKLKPKSIAEAGAAARNMFDN